MKKSFLIAAAAFGICIIPCVLTKSVVLAITCVIASIVMLMINDFRAE